MATPPPSASHFSLQHEIFVLDAYLQKPLGDENRESIATNLIESLLKALRMEPLAPLQVFPASDLRAPGWSFLIPITTSHIGGHYFESPGKYPHLRIDVYSCASVNWHKIIDILHSQLGLRSWRATFIDRQIEEDESERVLYDISGEGDLVLDETKIRGHNPALVARRIVDERMAVAARS